MPVQHVRLGEDRLTSGNVNDTAAEFLQPTAPLLDEDQLRRGMEMPVRARACLEADARHVHVLRVAHFDFAGHARRDAAASTTTDALSMLFPNVAVTREVAVRVAVSYLAEQSDPSTNRWFWSYHVRIENGSGVAVQLLSRSWVIVDGRGTVHEVHGEASSARCR